MTNCNCYLSDQGLAFFDAVDHMPECALLVALEARIAGNVIPADLMADPDEPAWFITNAGRDSRLVYVPGQYGDKWGRDM